jgi:hypothetical protein
MLNAIGTKPLGGRIRPLIRGESPSPTASDFKTQSHRPARLASGIHSGVLYVLHVGLQR